MPNFSAGNHFNFMGPELEAFIAKDDQLFDVDSPISFSLASDPSNNSELQPIIPNQANKSSLTSGLSCSSSSSKRELALGFIAQPSIPSGVKITELEPISLVATELVTVPMVYSWETNTASFSNSHRFIRTELVDLLSSEGKVTGWEIQPFVPVQKENNKTGPKKNSDVGGSGEAVIRKEADGLALAPYYYQDALSEHVPSVAFPQISALIRRIIAKILKMEFYDKLDQLEPKPVEAIPGSGVLLIGPPKRYRVRTTIVGEVEFSFLLPQEYDIFAADIDKLLEEKPNSEPAPNIKEPSRFSFRERLQGWKLEIRQRVDGRDDKYYYHDSVQFRSTVEVTKFILDNVYPIPSSERKKYYEEYPTARSSARKNRRMGTHKRGRRPPSSSAARQKQEEKLEEELIMAHPINSFRPSHEKSISQESETDSEATESDEEIKKIVGDQRKGKVHQPMAGGKTDENPLALAPYPGDKQGSVVGNHVERAAHEVGTPMPDPVPENQLPSNHVQVIPEVLVPKSTPASMDEITSNPVVRAANNPDEVVTARGETQMLDHVPSDQVPDFPMETAPVETNDLPTTNYYCSDSLDDIFAQLDDAIETPEDRAAASVLQNHEIDDDFFIF